MSVIKPPAGSSTPAAGSITVTMLNGTAAPSGNVASNPGFNFAQKQTPGTLTTIPNATYGPDCWKVERSAADVQYQRLANAGSSWSGSANRGRFKQITNPGRMVIYQPLENLLTLELASQSIAFQISCQNNVARNWRMALINYSGAADTIPAMISDFTTSPMTLNANFAYLGSFIVNSDTNVQKFFLTLTPPNGGISNLILAVMVESVMAVNDTIDLGEAALNLGAVIRTYFQPLSPSEDLARVERFYEKSYDIDTPPATVTLLGAVNGTQVGTAATNPIRYRQRKPKNPAIALYSTATGTALRWRDTTLNAELTVGAQNIGLAAAAVKVSAAGVNGDDFAGHYTLDSSL